MNRGDIMKKDIFLKTQICPRCGRISEATSELKCFYCDTNAEILKDVNYWGFGHRGEPITTTEKDKELLRLNFQPKEKYDATAWLCREHYEESQKKFGIPDDLFGSKFFDEVVKYHPDHIQPQCPHCSSYFTRKISTSSKLFSVGLFGLASNKVGKQWYCHTCKTYF